MQLVVKQTVGPIEWGVPWPTFNRFLDLLVEVESEANAGAASQSRAGDFPGFWMTFNPGGRIIGRPFMSGADLQLLLRQYRDPGASDVRPSARSSPPQRPPRV